MDRRTAAKRSFLPVAAMLNPPRAPSRLESQVAHATAPLLELARQITGLETSLARVHVDAEPSLRAAGAHGSRTFWAQHAAPVGKEHAILCGASQPEAELTPAQTDAMSLIAECLQRVFDAKREACLAREREHIAEKEAIQARNQARQHANDFQQMERLAHTDELTGLLNRRAFMDRWEDESVRSADREYSIALIVIDADNFKLVNDTLGHLQGDVVLRAIGATLLEVTETPDIVARLGGDEFAIVSTHSTTEDLVELAVEIRTRFAVLAAELGVDTTLSIGIVSSDDCQRCEMIAQADLALYRSKAAEGNEAQFFMPRLSSFAPYPGADILQRRAVR